MNFLRKLSGIRERYRQYAPPMYWLDKIVDEWADAHYSRLRTPFGRVGANGPVTRRVTITGKVLAVLQHPASGEGIVIPGANIVTNDGDTYYAQSAAGEAPTDDFDGGSAGLRLGDNATAPTKTDTDVTNFLAGTGHAVDGTYPQTNDADGDNTGAGVDILTWRYSYTTGEGNANGIAEGAIVDDITTPTAALTHFLFAASFNKTSSDTLKVFVNHEFAGA